MLSCDSDTTTANRWLVSSGGAHFRWHTTADGPNQAPAATVSILPSRPGDKLSFPGELSAQALGVSTQPDRVTASAVIVLEKLGAVRV